MYPAIDGLALDYSVKFPLSLIISRKTITRYQLIFRFLLHLHHLESSLGSMWVEHKSDMWRRHSGNEDVERWKYRIFSLRNRMLSFVRQVLAFATGEVLQTQWRALEAKLEKVQTVDQLLRDHVDFLDTCLKQCMLTTSKLLSVSVLSLSYTLLTAAGLRQADSHHCEVCQLSTVVERCSTEVSGRPLDGIRCRQSPAAVGRSLQVRSSVHASLQGSS